MEYIDLTVLDGGRGGANTSAFFIYLFSSYYQDVVFVSSYGFTLG